MVVDGLHDQTGCMLSGVLVREFYNVSEDPYQIYNIINATDASLISKLSVLTYMIGSCAGKNCSDPDFISITELLSMNNNSPVPRLSWNALHLCKMLYSKHAHTI